MTRKPSPTQSHSLIRLEHDRRFIFLDRHRTPSIQTFQASFSLGPKLDYCTFRKDGKVIKTIHAGSVKEGQLFRVNGRKILSPGNYKIRYREGITLEVDGDLGMPKGGKWLNPVDVIATDTALFVWDSGKRPLKNTLGDAGAPAPQAEDSADAQAFIHKFFHDGKPDRSFGDRGRVGPFLGPKDGLPESTRYYDVHAIAADQEGRVYISSIYHEALVINPKGERSSQTIGGWDNDPHGPKCTPYVISMAVGAGNRLYIPNSYGKIRVYDRTREKLDGILYSADADSPGDDRSIASDMVDAVYLISKGGDMQKFRDTGKSLEPEYFSTTGTKMMNPCGPCASGGLVWVASHGGPPLWDSDGGEILLFWDSGSELRYIERYGTPGKSAEKLEFLNPSAVAISPDHLQLWVAEDGVTNAEGPPGNARIRKFKLNAARTKEISLEVKN